MKRPTDSAAFAITLLLISGSFAQAPPLDITGFGDICYNGEEDRFAIGQAEVDLGVALDEGIDLEIAVALDKGNFSTGSFTVDFHLFGSEGNHFRPVGGIDHSGIIAGQFDVPFGLDWLVYPAIDRKLVSGPVAVENIHDFGNDFGIQGYLKAGRLDAVLFAVNGFGYEAEEADVEMNLALGGRAGIGILPQLEVGGSYAGFFDPDYALDMALIGADAQFGYRNFSAKGEFLVHRLGLAGDKDLIPGAPADDPQRTSFRSLRVLPGSCGIVVCVIPVRQPFPQIAGQIVNAIGTDTCRVTACRSGE